MKPIIFKASPFNPVLMADLAAYEREYVERKGSAPARHYMRHKNQSGYTRIRQTRKFIIVEWME